MELNWTPEGIVDFIVGTIVLIAAILCYFEPKIKKLRPIFFIRLCIFLLSLFFYLDGFAILLLSTVLSRIEAILMIPALISLIIGINYIVSESYKSIGLIILCGFGGIVFYLAALPSSAKIVTEMGYPNVNWIGLFALMGDLTQVIGGIILVYWGLRSWIAAPLLIKKEALLFFIGLLIIGPATLIIYPFYYFYPIFIIIADLMMGLGIIIMSLSIIREPKILYILPFTVYRILVKSRKGYPLYDHNWTESNIDENLFTGFLNAVQVMSNEVINIGGLLDINLEKGILILKESKFITVGLVASKSSKLLRECVLQFTRDFERKFERELKKSVIDISQYEGAFELIEKYFSNFPYKMVKSRKEPLLLTGKYIKIPLELENKLRRIFPDQERFESIKAELIKSPISLFSEFLNLYNELKEEMKLISREENKFLDEQIEKEENKSSS